jgi:hypothetical protein
MRGSHAEEEADSVNPGNEKWSCWVKSIEELIGRSRFDRWLGKEAGRPSTEEPIMTTLDHAFLLWPMLSDPPVLVRTFSRVLRSPLRMRRLAARVLCAISAGTPFYRPFHWPCRIWLFWCAFENRCGRCDSGLGRLRSASIRMS